MSLYVCVLLCQPTSAVKQEDGEVLLKNGRLLQAIHYFTAVLWLYTVFSYFVNVNRGLNVT